MRRLLERLIHDGQVSRDAMDEVIAAVGERRAERELLRRGMVSEDHLAQAVAKTAGAPFVDLLATEVDPRAVARLAPELCRRHSVLPIAISGQDLTLAMLDPGDVIALDDVTSSTGLTVHPVVAAPEAMQVSLDRYVRLDEQIADLSSELSESATANVVTEVTENLDDDGEDAPIVRFVNKVMLDAIKRGASDIHFEPYERSYRIRFRLDGVLKEVATPPVQLAIKLAARLKVMSRLDIAERRVPQDGRIKMRISKNRAIDFRLSTCPTLFGEKIVMRILDSSSATLGIDSLGYEPFQKKLYMEALAKPHGMILVTGPTGSGKTVSLYTGLNILNTEDTNISTAEDPVEIMLPGINQVNINPKVGLTFAGALRAFLRQDPDVIMVGEIRDLETAEIALKAAQTGHLVLSTLHTNDAPKTLTRLVDMGVKPYAIATSVSLIIAQRLARRLCNNCKAKLDIPDEALRKEGFTPDEIATGLQIFGPVGCTQCTDGYKGRTGIYEVMPVSEEIGRIIMTGGSVLDIKEQAQREGVWGLRQSALSKVKMGITSLDEINRVTVD